MNLRLSHILSYLLHPVVIPLGFALIFLFVPAFSGIKLPVQYKLYMLSVIAAFTVVLPLLIVFTLKYLRLVTSIEIGDRRERIIPLALSLICYGIMLRILRSAPVPEVLRYFITVATVSLFAGLAIHYFYKISLHALAWGASAAAVFRITATYPEFLVLLLFTVLLAGVAGYARLNENAHSQAQVYLGYAAGILAALALGFRM